MPDGTPSPDRIPQRGGRGRRNDLFAPKGRVAEPAALPEVRESLGDRPRRADLLIEHLHLLQDHYGHLSARHLVALAEEMQLPLAAVYETASFYAHFDLVMDGETPPPPLTIRVCDRSEERRVGTECISRWWSGYDE